MSKASRRPFQSPCLSLPSVVRTAESLKDLGAALALPVAFALGLMLSGFRLGAFGGALVIGGGATPRERVAGRVERLDFSGTMSVLLSAQGPKLAVGQRVVGSRWGEGLGPGLEGASGHAHAARGFEYGRASPEERLDALGLPEGHEVAKLLVGAVKLLLDLLDPRDDRGQAVLPDQRGEIA